MKEPSDVVLSESQRIDASNHQLLERIAGALGMPVSNFYHDVEDAGASADCSGLLAQFKSLGVQDRQTVADLIASLSRQK